MVPCQISFKNLSGGALVPNYATRWLYKTIVKLTAKKSTWRITKWSPKLRAMAPSKKGLIHGGMRSKDWFSDKALMALHISIVTKIDRAMVMGSGAWK
jgi:hypothetical protein